MDILNSKYLELTSYSSIRITGNDKLKFLQGQITCDLKLLNKHTAIYGSYANIQGRVISSFYTSIDNDENILLSLPSETAEKTLNTLKKYAIFSKVNFTTPNYKIIALFGDSTPSILNNIFNQSIDWDKQTNLNINSIHIIKTVSKVPAFLLIGEEEVMINIIDDFLKKLDLSSLNEWKKFLINQNICELNADTSEKFLPSELNLIKKGAISFKKGCFMGQEVIARLYYLGKSKKELKQVKIDVNDTSFSLNRIKIQNKDAKNVGELISSANITKNTLLSLALINSVSINDKILLLTKDGHEIGKVSIISPT